MCGLDEDLLRLDSWGLWRKLSVVSTTTPRRLPHTVDQCSIST
jgi:hypothetical protein